MEVESIFVEEGNQMGGVAGEILAARVGHLSASMEDCQKHSHLMSDLLAHINNR